MRSVNRPGAEAVLKTVCTARYEGRDLSAPPIRKANRSGTGAGWKPRGRGNSVGIVRSAFRHHGKSTGRVPGARSKRDGAGNGMGFVPSAFRQFSRDRGCIGAPLRRREARRRFQRRWAETARRSHEPEAFGATPVPATTLGRYARGQSSVAVNHVPSGFARSNRCPAHHAAVAQRQSHTLPTCRRRIVTGRSLQFALLANLVIAPV
jgi:hypothetical protein